MENNTNISGTIINVQHFCVDDGPGIRTTVFLKGCPLRCAWCHNPESQSNACEYMFRQYKCTDCGICASVCKNGVHSFENGIHNVNRERCGLCGKCTLTCCADALEISGREITVCEIMDEVLADRVFYKRSGGVTISGGEPLFQSEFTFALLLACKDKGIHTCIETCGYGKAEDIKRIAELCDIFLFDYKLTDSALHKKYTGVNNELILENLKLICAMGASVILRCPMIPDVNMNEDHYNAIAELANKYPNVQEIHLEPYHPMGIGKAVSLGRTCDYDRSEFLERSELDDVCSYIADKVSVEVKVI
ncbi:MAG: glycyl-radical enzyme activating protein [Clostridiales bacterium]|nr:glycyl-radical enzyme activating protein [Clostridiales bacterium]